MGCILSISWKYRAQIYLCRHPLWRHLRFFFRSRPIPYFVVFQTYTKILRACLFCPRRYETNLLYSRFRVLKLDDMIKMKFAKFIFKYSNTMLPNSFNNYFIKLENMHNYNTRQKSRNEYLQTSFGTETGKKTLQDLGLNEWKSIPQEYRQCSFAKFKKFCKNKLLNKYN